MATAFAEYLATVTIEMLRQITSLHVALSPFWIEIEGDGRQERV